MIAVQYGAASSKISKHTFFYRNFMGGEDNGSTNKMREMQKLGQVGHSG